MVEGKGATMNGKIGDMSARAFVAAGALLAVTTTSTSWAGPASSASSASHEAVAEALFTDAKALMAAGKYAQACPKLEESQRLDGGVGTQLALASCLLKVKAFARAWTVMQEAGPAAQRQRRPDRVRLVAQLRKEVDAHVAFVQLVLEPGWSPTSVRIELDQTALDSAALGTRIPVDPGEHHVRLEADHYVPASTTFVAHEAESKTVPLPRLQPEPVPAPSLVPLALPPPSKAAAPAPAPRRELRVEQKSWKAPVVVTGLGLVAIGVGTTFGILALSDSARSRDLCPELRCSSPEAVELNDRAKTYGVVSSISIPVGAVLTGVGIVLLWGALRSSTPPKVVGQLEF